MDSRVVVTEAVERPVETHRDLSEQTDYQASLDLARWAEVIAAQGPVVHHVLSIGSIGLMTRAVPQSVHRPPKRTGVASPVREHVSGARHGVDSRRGRHRRRTAPRSSRPTVRLWTVRGAEVVPFTPARRSRAIRPDPMDRQGTFSLDLDQD
jgi:hypothetical protein